MDDLTHVSKRRGVLPESYHTGSENTFTARGEYQRINSDEDENETGDGTEEEKVEVNPEELLKSVKQWTNISVSIFPIRYE